MCRLLINLSIADPDGEMYNLAAETVKAVGRSDMQDVVDALNAARLNDATRCDMQNVADAFMAVREEEEEYYVIRANIPLVYIKLDNIRKAKDHIPKIRIKDNVKYAADKYA